MGKLDFISAVQAALSRPSINVLRVASAILGGETVTIGGMVFEASKDALTDTSRVLVDLSGSSFAFATQTLTLSGNAVADETVTIGSTVYTFKASPSAAFQVKVGANAAESIQNLLAAIMTGEGAGTLYGTGTTPHPDVVVTGSTATTLVITAKVEGTAGNSIATTETMTNGAWGSTTMAGGAAATADQFSTALVAAINAQPNCRVRAEKISSNEVLIYTKIADETVACAETLGGTNNAWAAASTYGGSRGEVVRLGGAISRTPNATEVALGNLHFVFSLNVNAAQAFVRTSAGASAAWDGATTITGRRVTLGNGGSTDWAADSTVTLIVG